MLQSLGVLLYSPRLESMIRNHQTILHGSKEEVEIRGCTVWAVEKLRQEIERLEKASTNVSSDKNAEHQHENDHEYESSEVIVQSNGEAELKDQKTETETETMEQDNTAIPKTQDPTPKKQKQQINAVLIDFFLYDVAKEKEKQEQEEGREEESLPHHRTRSIFYWKCWLAGERGERKWDFCLWNKKRGGRRSYYRNCKDDRLQYETIEPNTTS